MGTLNHDEDHEQQEVAKYGESRGVGLNRGAADTEADGDDERSHLEGYGRHRPHSNFRDDSQNRQPEPAET